MFKLATPISHLFKDSNNSNKIIELSDCLECRDRTIDDKSDNQELFHCELEPIHKLSEEDFEYLKRIKDEKKDLKLITFHMASSCSNPNLDFSKIKSGMFELGGYSYSEDEMYLNAKENFERIKEIFGDEIKIGVENNNYYPTDAYKFITDEEFIKKIVYDNDLYFLFDIAHAQVTAHNKGMSFEEYKNNLPLEKAIQLHICSPAVDDSSKLAYDAHDYPNDFKLQEVERLIKKYSQIEYLTVEYYRDMDNLLTSLKKVKELV